VLEDIRGERQYQLERWGVQCHDIATWLAIIGEEQGEVCKAFLDNQRSNNHTDRLRMRKHLRKEAVQLAASAAAFVQFLDDGEA
jgi:uncharacterized protein Smg (DUF494 family)